MNSGISETIIRKLFGFVLPACFIILALLPFFLFMGRLPDPIAVHWGIDGRSNGSMRIFFIVINNLAFVGASAFAMFFSSRRKPAYKGTMSLVMSVTVFICTLIAGISWSIVYNNLDAPDWTAAGMKGSPFVLLAVPVLTAALAFWLGRLIEVPDFRVPVLPSVNLKPGDRAMWIGTARSLWGLPLLIGCMVFGTVMLTIHGTLIGLIPIFVAVLSIIFISIRVLADSRGVLLSFGPMNWPRKLIPLANICQARAVDIIPMQHGGWGYRGSMRFKGRVSIILRGGEGLELDLKDNKKLFITVDGANEGAGLINDLIARN